jgi:hypothetical protein
VTVIRFTTAAGKPLGDVRVDGEQLDSDLAVVSIAKSWTAMGKTAAQFVKRYADWSNGYISSEQQDGD